MYAAGLSEWTANIAYRHTLLPLTKCALSEPRQNRANILNTHTQHMEECFGTVGWFYSASLYHYSPILKDSLKSSLCPKLENACQLPASYLVVDIVYCVLGILESNRKR